MNAAQQHAAAIMAAANNQLTPEQSRHCFLAVSSLVMAARDAEQASYLAMAELMGNGNPRDASEYAQFMRDHLRKVHEQLKFVSGVLAAGAAV
ncbi:MAG: hypothetical protein AAGC78_10400 [Cellvibrio sp.]|uniref:hypothetical protein n=1 Tax=Cellvibrio sp. TaxID=1965322 RepID=UPI0031A24C25